MTERSPVSRNTILADLKDAFPRQAVSLATFNTYLAHTDDIPEHVLRVAVVTLIRREEFFPSIAMIRETCADQMLGLPTAAEAIAQIEARRTWRLQLNSLDHDERSEPPPIDRLALRVLQQHLGGVAAYLHSENPSMAASQFTKAYAAARLAEVRAVQTGNFQLQLDRARPM